MNAPPFALTDVFSLVTPHLPEPLVSVSAQERIFDLANRLPPLPRVLLECPLEAPSEVDLSICTLNTDYDRAILPATLNTQTDDSPAWQSARRFVDWWTHEEQENLPDSAWLEFDLRDHKLAAPAVFLPLAEGPKGSNFAPSVEGLDLLQPGVKKLLEDWVATLPSHAKPTFAGMMLSRDSQHLRLNLSKLNAEEAFQWLIQHGAIEDTNLCKVFKKVYELSGTPILTVDLFTDSLGRRFGLECQPNAVASDELFVLLQGLNLCQPELYKSLGAWTGHTTVLDEGVNWPLPLVFEALSRGEVGPSLLVRHLNHVKFVFEQDELKQAKAYLAFTHAVLPSLDKINELRDDPRQ